MRGCAGKEQVRSTYSWSCEYSSGHAEGDGRAGFALAGRGLGVKGTRDTRRHAGGVRESGKIYLFMEL
jgi:hypothetical protein